MQEAVILEVATDRAEAIPGAEAIAGEPATAETSPAEGSSDESEIDVWWPKDTGPFRRERQKPEARPQHHRHKRRERPEQKAGEAGGKPAETEGKPAETGRPRPPKHGKPPHRPQRPERKPEKPIDPDSPFAILGVLKAQLANKS
jgi:ATP-dependent RNA helicase SUPV3L1/SUV3